MRNPPGRSSSIQPRIDLTLTTEGIRIHPCGAVYTLMDDCTGVENRLPLQAVLTGFPGLVSCCLGMAVPPDSESCHRTPLLSGTGDRGHHRFARFLHGVMSVGLVLLVLGIPSLQLSAFSQDTGQQTITRKIIMKVYPKYPQLARQYQLKGTVQIEVTDRRRKASKAPRDWWKPVVSRCCS